MLSSHITGNISPSSDFYIFSRPYLTTLTLTILLYLTTLTPTILLFQHTAPTSTTTSSLLSLTTMKVTWSLHFPTSTP